ncbi:LysR family transcriptional regulator [Herbaspirillum sp. RU 5E]|uniref:LysR family transcriptional regulator n=1 Tax=Herbaspirillum aquaticum TaxID=568783 RepID=A0A225SQ16_9BURK|nr:LysR substrate-binding domain-containing protein [Herbaspirillum aquaticum]MBW9336087.1 LysR family transcriptional regulator [Herbaspirillum sp. RU 5E]OWY33107.1 LysR family transcriptional regulator [Herbaspirillum aquaticum]
MELRQLRYFIRVVELGSMGRAAADLGVVTSALSQQISRLEGELSTRLLRRTTTGVVATDAGLAFWHQAQLALRHVDEASRAAQNARMSGHVSVGFAPTTASVLALAFMSSLRARYPDIRLHLVESLSGNLAAMLNARQLDLAILFETNAGKRLTATPLLHERLFLVGSHQLAGMPKVNKIHLKDIGTLPLVMPSGTHGLRAVVTKAFTQAKCEPNIVAEIDGLATLMDVVRTGLAATIQPGAAASRLHGSEVRLVQVADKGVRRTNLLASLPEDELSPAALATRIVLRDVVRELLTGSHWLGASLHES